MIRERERERERLNWPLHPWQNTYSTLMIRERERLNWPLHPWLDQSTSVPIQTTKLVIDWN